MEFEESLIPKFVWDFVKKNTSSIITAGILALIIWNFLKKKKISESLKEYVRGEKVKFRRGEASWESGTFWGTSYKYDFTVKDSDGNIQHILASNIKKENIERLDKILEVN